MEFLTSTPVRIALATVGTAAIAAGSYMIGMKHGAEEAQGIFEAMLPDIIKEAIVAANQSEENANN